MDALVPGEVPEARFVLAYQQRNITRDISKHLTSISYSDFLTGQADSLDIELEDSEGKWIGPWYPGHGDTLSLSLGWSGKALRELSSLEIDEIDVSRPPSTVSIRALATGINLAMRTTEHKAYENTTLDAVAQEIATRLGLTLYGSIEPIKLDRLTQQEPDLEFLRNLADEYDYAFKVTGKRLVFHSISELAKGKPVAELKLDELSNVRLRDQIRTIPQKVSKKHKDSKNKTLISYDLDQSGEVVAVPSSGSGATTSGDTKKDRKRAASEDQAKAKAKADLAKANRERTTGSWSMMGQPNMVSGNVVTLVAAGMLGGNYLILSAQHRINRNGGYTVELSLCRVSAPSISLTVDMSTPDLALSNYGFQPDGALA